MPDLWAFLLLCVLIAALVWVLKVVDDMADKWMKQGNPKYTTPRTGITVEEVPQK